MASRTVVQFEDDLDGSTAAETISFGLDGVMYEIDLSVKNSEKLRRLLQRYTNAGRRVGGRSTRGHGNGTARSDPAQLAAIREWARHKGYEVGDRGRVPVHIVESYHATAGR
jgi:nucleoid-associated protein Lsr2